MRTEFVILLLALARSKKTGESFGFPITVPAWCTLAAQLCPNKPVAPRKWPSHSDVNC